MAWQCCLGSIRITGKASCDYRHANVSENNRSPVTDRLQTRHSHPWTALTHSVLSHPGHPHEPYTSSDTAYTAASIQLQASIR